jgi:hypothetical protein
MVGRAERLAAIEADAILLKPATFEKIKFDRGDSAILHPADRYLLFIDQLACAMNRFHGAELPPPPLLDHPWMPPDYYASVWNHDLNACFRVDGRDIQQAWVKILSDPFNRSALMDVQARLADAPLAVLVRRLKNIQPFPDLFEPQCYLEWKLPEDRRSQDKALSVPILTDFLPAADVAAAVARERQHKIRCLQGYVLKDHRPGDPEWFASEKAAERWISFRSCDKGI